MTTKKEAKIEARVNERAMIESAMKKMMATRHARTILLTEGEHIHFMADLEKPPKANKALRHLIGKHGGLH